MLRSFRRSRRCLGWAPASPSIGPSASVAERQSGEFLSEPIGLSRVGGVLEPAGEGEETFLLGALRFKTCFDEVNEDTVGAGPARLRDGAHPLGEPNWK